MRVAQWGESIAGFACGPGHQRQRGTRRSSVGLELAERTLRLAISCAFCWNVESHGNITTPASMRAGQGSAA